MRYLEKDQDGAMRMGKVVGDVIAALIYLNVVAPTTHKVWIAVVGA